MNLLRIILFVAALAYFPLASHGHAQAAAILLSFIIPVAVGIGMLIGKHRA